MGVGEILLASPEAGVALTGSNTEYRRPVPPANASFASKVPEAGQRTDSEPQSREAKKSRDQARHTIEELLGGNSELSIAVDQETREIVVKVINSETHEVIRQIPPDEALRLAHALKKQRGALLDELA